MKAPVCLLAFAILTTVPACRHPSAVPPLISKNELPQKSPAVLAKEKSDAEKAAVVIASDMIRRNVAKIRAGGYDPAMIAEARKAFQNAWRSQDVTGCPVAFQRAWLGYVQAVEMPGSGFADLAAVGAAIYLASPAGTFTAAGNVMKKEGDRTAAIRTAWQSLEMQFMEAGVRFASPEPPSL